MNPKSKTPEITIIGAGLVGSLLALGLAQKGYQVVVFESRDDLRKVDISAGKSINLALANRGIKALVQQQVFEKVMPLLISMQGRMVHISEHNEQFQPYGLKDSDVIYSVSRGALNALLLDEAEQYDNVSFHFNHRVSDVDLTKNTLRFTDNTTTHHFARVIGTDGANSVLRDVIIEKTQDNQLTIDELSHNYKELHLPPNSAGQHQLATNALHIWPREDFMLIALPNLDGSFTLTLFLAKTGKESFETLTNAQEISTFIHQHFPDVAPKIDKLIDNFQNNPTGRLATVRLNNWHYEDSAMLLGDAAHAIVPFHGQGMNCGFEDVYDFLNHLPDASEPETNWHYVFDQTTKQRKPNADAIADMALENYVEMRSSVAKDSYQRQKAIASQLQLWFPARFSPRYAMVMFDDIEYYEAQKLGEIHKNLLAKLDMKIEQGTVLTKELASQALETLGL